MVPLYAARVQELGPDDVAMFKCGACGHTAELWPSGLIQGFGLKPTLMFMAGVRAPQPCTIIQEGSGYQCSRHHRNDKLY